MASKSVGWSVALVMSASPQRAELKPLWLVQQKSTRPLTSLMWYPDSSGTDSCSETTMWNWGTKKSL